MDSYAQWVAQNPLWSAAVQFGILGTLGEILSALALRKPLSTAGTGWQIACKIFAWGLLGVVIKYGFTGMKGFVDALIAKGMMPPAEHGTFLWAFMVSVFTNVFFGPQMMAFHRLEDCIIAGRWHWTGLRRAWFTLLWFWIPAHTLTFVLPVDYQIGLAALWSIVLGLILGVSSAGNGRAPSKENQSL